MLLTETIESLSKQFITRYGKQFSELNKNVYPSAKNDNGSYEIPIPIVGPNGGTIVVGPAPVTLAPPASVQVQLKVMKEQHFIYRLAIPYSEAEIAAMKPEYFNYLFDSVLNKALGNYAATVGDANVVRFGTMYCTYERQEGVFTQLPDTSLEIQLSGSWASAEEDYT